MMSFTARAQRRGAISQLEFRAEMDKLGFIETHKAPGKLHEFTHPDCLGRLFSVPMWESYSRALERLADEWRALRRWSE